MVSERTLRNWYEQVFIAGATLAGGPQGGIAAAAFLKTELGKAGLDDMAKWTKDDKRTPISKGKAAKAPKRKASAYSKRYGKAFKKVMPKYRTKNGSWKKDGFKKAQKAAHKEAKK
tara:strand:+ start:1286 stop:1633 length:348 start_codon:yes stop_codon:yes gene_type:complete